jgi:hypothetical protein
LLAAGIAWSEAGQSFEISKVNAKEQITFARADVDRRLQTF